MWYKVAVVA